MPILMHQKSEECCLERLLEVRGRGSERAQVNTKQIGRGISENESIRKDTEGGVMIRR